MNHATRSIAFAIVAIFLGSLATGMMTNLYQTPVEILEEEQVIATSSQATSPGHVVFGQYISSDNCYHCSKTGGGSDAHHSIKQNHPDEYVYLTYMSASYGDTDTARAGNVAPYNWAWSTGGAPDAYFGDRTDKNQGGANNQYTTYDSLYSAGGGMHSTVNDYGMSAAISQNGGNYDISISYKYTGSGSAASNMKLYAALVDKDCTGFSYSSGIPHGYNCWMAWLTAGDTYKSKSSGTGSAFHSVSVTSSDQTETWSSVPTSVVPGGLSKAIVIGVLMAGNQVSVGGSSPHVYHAIDSTMGPKMDIGVTDVKVSNPTGTSSYVIGDTLTLEADVKNLGDLDYTDGGSLEFFYKNGVTTTPIDTVSVPTLNVASGSAYLTASSTFDTSNLPSNAWSTTFGARLTGITGDMGNSNNNREVLIDHDRPPLSKTPQVIGSDVVQRGEYLSVLSKGDADDNVDSIDTLTFEVEISPAGQNAWDGSVVTGGENIVYRDTAQEGREYIVTPSMEMSAGNYDIRSRTVDSRNQVSNWAVAQDGFELANGRPTVTADPIPTVMCDSATKVSMVNNIADPETSLSELIVTSDSANFIAWHAATEEIEVLFPYDNGCPVGQKGIEVKVDDGGDYSDTGELPYGTLLFNIIENGQPRWQGLPIQMIEEGGSGLLSLTPYLSDTDDTGAQVDSSTLSLEVMSNSNPEAVSVELKNSMLSFEAVDDDVNGETTVTLRASDGEQSSDQTVTIRINPINDAPRLDMTDIEDISLKRNKQMVVNLKARMVDVDNPLEQAFITVTPSEPGAARYNILDGNMILLFEETGEQTVTISSTDGFATNTYTMTVDVYDALPFYLSRDNDGSGHMYVQLEDTYIGQTPTATLLLTDDAPVMTSMDLTINLCSELTGVCYFVKEQPLDVAKSNVGWSLTLDMRESGSQYKDYYDFKITAAVDENGDDYKTLGDGLKFTIEEEMPAPVDMDEEMLSSYVEGLIADIAALEATIAATEGDTTSLEEELASLNTDFGVACDDPRADCPEEQASSSTQTDSAGLDTNLILIIIGVLIIAALLGVMFMRGGRGVDHEEVKWDQATLPVHDTVANSMYGGAQEIFQQPVAAVPPIAAVAQPTVAPVVQAGPPLPPGGLPVGWSMEQWAHYGQQYLDQMNQQ